ncbi:hypothetical protein M3J09_009402 [Ascochyta lentis]
MIAWVWRGTTGDALVGIAAHPVYLASTPFHHLQTPQPGPTHYATSRDHDALLEWLPSLRHCDTVS